MNASINALREWAIPKNWAPVPQGVKVNVDKNDIGKHNTFKKGDQQFSTYSLTQRLAVTAPKNYNKVLLGDPSNYKQPYPKMCEMTSDRYNPVLVQAFNENPFTQSLHSAERTYNDPFPIIRPQIPIA